MDCDLLAPPNAVRGMRILVRETFQKRVQVPRLRVAKEKAYKVVSLIKNLLLKIENRHPVRKIKVNENDPFTWCEILLHPMRVISWEFLPIDSLVQLDVKPADFYIDELELCYNDWRADEIIKSVLPLDQEGLSSYSRIGHIVHVNLRDHLLPYKQLIGQVLLDKVPGCLTVVHKAASIDGTYQNFVLELLGGVKVYQVQMKECGALYHFNFERVKWDPRLTTERKRITKMLKSGDVLYDVFAGVGPFSIPAARKGCWVFANDINPENYKWLQHNTELNKCKFYLQTFNRDGRDFIRQDVKADLLEHWRAQQLVEKIDTSTFHIVMNLPGNAAEFLDAFRALLQPEDLIGLDLTATNFKFPIVHIYSFVKRDNINNLVRDLVEQHLGLPLRDNLDGIFFVRNVAPQKYLYRIAFRLSAEILTTPNAAKRNLADDEAQSELPVKVPKCND